MAKDERDNGIFRKEELSQRDVGCTECARRIAVSMDKAGHLHNAGLNTLTMALGIWLAHNMKPEGFAIALPLIEQMLQRQYAALRPKVEVMNAEPAGRA